MQDKTQPISILAVDSLQSQPRELERAFKTAKTYGELFGSRILAATVLGAEHLPWPVELSAGDGKSFDCFIAGWLDDFVSDAKSTFSTETILKHRARTRDEVQSVLNLAGREKAKAIFLITHASDEWRPLAGFTRSILAQANFPLLTINAKAPPVDSIRTIVFATDFSPIADLAFQAVLKLAKAAGARVSIIHHLEPPFLAQAVSNLGTVSQILNLDNLLIQAAETAGRFGRSLIEFAKTENVTATFELEGCFPQSSVAILKKAEDEKADLIVMGLKHRGPTGLFGGAANEVIAKTTCPVLLLSEEASLSLL